MTEPVEQMNAGDTRPVLIVLHQRRSCSGRIGRWFDARGIAMDVRRPLLGDPLPDTLSCHCGAVVFGGPMSVNDPCEFIRREIDWMEVPLREGKPLLGICLGAQMIARQLGARVGPGRTGKVEVGYYPIQPLRTDERRAMVPGLPNWPHQVFQYHCEGFDVPACGQALVRGNQEFPNQAFGYGKAVGLQFHPEVTLEMIARWSFAASDHYERPGARTRLDIVEEHQLFGPEVEGWLSQFLTLWMRGGIEFPTASVCNSPSVRA